MNIALVSPLNARGSISSWSLHVALDLIRRGHSVRLVRSESDSPAVEAPLTLPALDVPFPVMTGRDISPIELGREHDVVVYAIGNHFGHHGEVPRLLDGAPGVVILHDADLTNFHRGWLEVASRRHPAFPEPAIPPFNDNPSTLLGWFASRATAAVVHGGFYSPVVRANCLGPVSVLRVSHFDLGVPAPRRREPGSHLVVATVGDANANKRHTAVIEAIGRHQRLRDNAEYRVLGHTSPERRLELTRLAERRGVKLSISGWLEVDALRAEVAKADVLCCLRWPVSEGASGSAILGLLSGRPIIVPDIGSFADLPDEFIMRVPAGNEVEALVGHLLTVLDAPDIGVRLGMAARAWARESFHQTQYVDGLLPLLERAEAAAPMVDLLRSIQAKVMRVGLSAHDPAVLRARVIAERAFGLVDPAQGAR